MSHPDSQGAPPRLVSLDAYRGFVMLAMASAGLGIPAVAKQISGNPTWEAVRYQLDHVPWVGCAAWDLIQPSFMFIVGVAMPFSYATRRAQGHSEGSLFAHAVWRAFVLVALGVFLSSAWGSRTNFIFTNVLCQIGLGYPLVFLLLGRGPRVQLAAAVAILIGYWALFAFDPLPVPGTANADLGLPAKWERLDGFLAHWEKNANPAAAFDAWFLNLFPRPGGKPYTFNEGGYGTLSFIPSMATMLFGVLAGGLLKGPRPGLSKVGTLLVAGAVALALGVVLDRTACPIVKRIWTPSWTLYSTGWTCALLAAFYGVIDLAGFRRWAFPLVVVGVNSIAMYVMAQLLKPWIAGTLKVHLGPDIFKWTSGGVDLAPMVQSTAVLFVLWLICLWMYRQRIFVKI